MYLNDVLKQEYTYAIFIENPFIFGIPHFHEGLNPDRQQTDNSLMTVLNVCLKV